MLGELAPARQQGAMLTTRDRAKSTQAMVALDAVNARFGAECCGPASTGMVRAWAGRHATPD
jgi:hypothetical protein